MREMSQERLTEIFDIVNSFKFPIGFEQSLMEEINVDENLINLYIDEYKKFLILILVSKAV